MLQTAFSKPGKASSCLPAHLADRADLCRPSPARMSISRFIPDHVNTDIRSGLLQQAEEYIRRSLAAEFVKEESGMTVNTDYTHFKGSCQGLRREREDVEWEGVLRGSKRRETSLERESSRCDKYTGLDHHHLQPLYQSGESDLTIEQSAACMAAESTSTRTTSSLAEAGCLLKLQPAAPAVAGYGDLHGEDDDDDEDDNSSIPCPNAMEAEFVSFDANIASASCVAPSYDVDKPIVCASRLHDDDHAHSAGEDHWHGGNYDGKKSAAVCASYGHHHTQHDDAAGHDWLDLRLGRNFDTTDMVHTSSSSSLGLCTLQLLPQDPDCASMKEKEKQRDLKTRSYEEAELASQAKPPLLSTQNYFDQAGTIRETHQHFYTNLLHLPMPTADSISQYIASRPGTIPTPNASRTPDASRILPFDHLPQYAMSHQQAQQLLLQDNSMHCRTPLYAFQEQVSFKPMSLSMSSPTADLQDTAGLLLPSSRDIVSRLPLPDFVNQNWDQIGESSAAIGSAILQPTTSFRELIASPFLREPNNRYDHMSTTPLIKGEPLSDINIHQNWPSKLQSHEKSSNFLPDQRLFKAPNNLENINYSSNMNMGLRSNSSSRSMTSWLSQALSASENLVRPRLLDDHSPPPQASMAPFLSTRKQNGDRKHTHMGSLLKCSASSTSRGSPGFWFGLQPAQPECCDGELKSAAKSMSYIRMKDGDVPISVVKKFLVAKLGLSDESQVVGLACRGKFVEETADLKSVRDEIWVAAAAAAGGFADHYRSTASSPKDSVMILTYQIS